MSYTNFIILWICWGCRSVFKTCNALESFKGGEVSSLKEDSKNETFSGGSSTPEFVFKNQSRSGFSNNLQSHFFHLVDRSPWPLLVSLGVLFLASGGAMYIHSVNQGFFLFLVGTFVLASVSFCWWSDIVYEGTGLGFHTLEVQSGLRMGMILFIVSEVMFFFCFFWGFFHSSLSPCVQIGCEWPPIGIIPMYAWGIPYLNTLILILSGIFVTLLHNGVVNGHKVGGGGLGGLDILFVESNSNQKFYSTLDKVKSTLSKVNEEPLVNGAGEMNSKVLFFSELELNGISCRSYNSLLSDLNGFPQFVFYTISVYNYIVGILLWLYFKLIIYSLVVVSKLQANVNRFMGLHSSALNSEILDTIKFVIYYVCGSRVYSCLSFVWLIFLWMISMCGGIMTYIKYYMIVYIETRICLFFSDVSTFFSGLLWEIMFVPVSVFKLIQIFSDGHMKVYIEGENRLWSSNLSNFWSGQSSRSNSINSCEVVGGRYKYIGLNEEDIWLLNSESYEEVNKIIYSSSYLDGSMGCKSVETDSSPVVKSYNYSYGMCWWCLNNLNEDLVKKSWTNYYPSNFCIGVYLVVFFVSSIWSKRFSSYAYYDAYYESGTNDKGTSLWVTFEDCPKNVEYSSFEEVNSSVAIMFVLNEVMFFCTVFNSIYLSDIMGIIWKLRWDIVLGTLLGSIKLLYLCFENCNEDKNEVAEEVCENGDGNNGENENDVNGEQEELFYSLLVCVLDQALDSDNNGFQKVFGDKVNVLEMSDEQKEKDKDNNKSSNEVLL